MDICIRCLKISLYILLTHSILISLATESHSRQKRLLWITDDGRLALPPGTILVISPSLSFPFVRYPPEGFLSNMTISIPFTIDFNKLGLTDNQNPYGVIPPVLARSMGRATGSLLGLYIRKFITGRRKRDTSDQSTFQLPPELENAFHGGERAILYVIVEEFLTNFGLNGKGCLLRAICEVHTQRLTKLGLFGEILKLFLTASKSPYSDFLEEYVKAEQDGQNHGECLSYVKECPKSLFQNSHSLYSKNSNEDFEKEKDDSLNSIEENEMPNEIITKHFPIAM